MAFPAQKKLKATVLIIQLSYQPKYRPFEEMIVAALLLITFPNVFVLPFDLRQASFRRVDKLPWRQNNSDAEDESNHY